MIRIVTDSGSMIPKDLRDRFEICVVPMMVSLDGREHHEGEGLLVADFYNALARGAHVTTAAPSPGAFAKTYTAAVAEGATEIVSIHTGSNYSAAVAAAHIAARMINVPVTVVDTKLASFPVSLCVWAAAELLATEPNVERVAAVAHATASQTGSVFVVGVPELARRGGRFVSISGEIVPTSVLELSATGLIELERVEDVTHALDLIAAHTRKLAALQPIRIGIGHAARPELATTLTELVADTAGVVELIQYEVGPSVGAHTGAGTVGIVYSPVDL